MVSCPRNIKTGLNLESVKVYDKYINKTKEIILGYRAYQHTKAGSLNYLFLPLNGKYFLAMSTYPS